MFSKPSFWIFIVFVLILLGIGAKMIAADFNESALAFGLLVVVALISLFVTFGILFG